MMTLAVYGTLRPGGALHDGWLRDAGWAGRGRVDGTLYGVDAQYPVAVLDDGPGITVDVFHVDPTSFERLMRMEEAVGYVRREVDVVLDAGVTVRAWICAWEHEVNDWHRGAVPDGDWITWTARRGAA